MTIPQDIQEKIEQQYPNPEGLSDILFDTRKINAAKRTGAAFGYSLAVQQVEEKEKEVHEVELKLLDCQQKALKHLEVCALTESQRKEWADMCIKKQARIEELEKGLENTLYYIDVKRVREMIDTLLNP